MKNQEKKLFNQYIRFSGIALQMGSIIGGGTYLGVCLDEKFSNKFSGFTITCSLLSIFISLFIVIKQLQQMNKDC